jgi:hypothetical protein
VAGGALEEVERRARRDVEQLRVFLLALDAGMDVRQRIFEIMRDVLVELVVLLVGDLRLGTLHSAEAWLTVSSSSVATCSFFSSSHSPSSSGSAA